MNGLSKSVYLYRRSNRELDTYFLVLFLTIFLSHIHATSKTDTRYQTRSRDSGKETKGVTQDFSTNRANTLFDDPDDIQRQLDNEARDRHKFFGPKAIWVFHFPTQFSHFQLTTSTEEPFRKRRLADFPEGLEEVVNWQLLTTPSLNTEKSTFANVEGWNYFEQGNWSQTCPACKGMNQSPINIPTRGIVKVKSARQIHFYNFAVIPKKLILKNYKDVFVLFGDWEANSWPTIYGGAAHSRRYKFHSLTFHWPSEHLLGNWIHPMESQALFFSAEYESILDAIGAAQRDPQSMLCVVTLYNIGYLKTHKGTLSLLELTLKSHTYDSIDVPTQPLENFVPAFKEYGCYYGSLTTPPCTEAVLWLIRAKPLTITRTDLNRLFAQGDPGQVSTRKTQSLNDRKIYFFN